jgi:Ca2+-transporting ATPase
VTVGLTEREAAARLAREGRNELLVARSLSWTAALARQLVEVVILVLLAAAILTAVVGDLPDMAVILTVVIINSVLGAAQEVRSGRALNALANLTAPQATVVRDGTVRDVDAREVVRGDTIRLAAGDIVAADACLISVQSLQADESMLTGEALAVAKERGETVYAGTVITRGRGDGTVVATAESTAVGGIARSVREARVVPTPVQRQLAVLGRRLALAVTAAAAVVALINLVAGRGVETSLVLAVSLAVAAIPESLPAVVSLSLAMAARRMAARGALARRLAAVESLGSVTVIATDKTGTLTTGRMRVGGTWTPPGDRTRTQDLLEAAVLCSDAGNGASGDRDDPTETALLDAALAAGVDVVALRSAFPRIAETPFDASTARMTTVHHTPRGAIRTIVKGSPEAVLAMVADPDARATANGFAAAGQRVLAVASCADDTWTLLGLLALDDPPRAEARETLAAFVRAGVHPIMITGDHPATAAAVARELGMLDNDGTEPGTDGWRGDVNQRVYARTRPQGKTAIVAALQARGELVAMTGDGVNDAPALRTADIGVAMGRRGTEVAKQAADIILTTDDLSTMVPAIAEGRRAYDNLRRFLHYALSGGLAEVLIMLVGPLVGFALPLQSGQILWVNLLTHGLPGVAMGNEPPAADVLSRPPRPSGEQLLDAHTARRVAILGSVIAAASLLAGGYARLEHRPWQSAIFLSLALTQLAVALALRPQRSGSVRNRALGVAVSLNVLLALLAVWWHPLRALLRTEALTPRDVLPCLVAAAVAAAVARWQSQRPLRPRRQAPSVPMPTCPSALTAADHDGQSAR